VSAILTLHVSQSPGPAQPGASPSSPAPFVLHRIIAAWGEGTSKASPPGGFGTAATANDATWTYRLWKAATWSTPGGDFDATGSASALIPTMSDGFATWGSTVAMVADVQGWLDNPDLSFA
jgi:hypothetical protein